MARETSGAATAQTSELLQRRLLSVDDLKKIAGDGRLYAILDACDEPIVVEKVFELGEEKAVCLYRGNLSPEERAIAPYLVHLDAATLDWITEALWEKPWGIFAVAEADLRALRKHFRKLLIVQDPDDQAMYFRYYDPRVLKTFLPTCDQEQIQEFLGPLVACGISDEVNRGSALVFQPTVPPS